MAKRTSARKRMDHTFSVFNLHVNKAGERADAEFIQQFGQETFDKHIKPCHDAGIMSIFAVGWHRSPFKLVWIALVTLFVNEASIASLDGMELHTVDSSAEGDA